MGRFFDPVKKEKRNPANGQNQFYDRWRTANQQSKSLYSINSALIFENHWSRYKYTLPLPAGSGNRDTPNIGQVYGAFQIQEISESALQRKTISSQKLADNKFTSEAT